MEESTPDKSKVVLRAALDAEIKQTWFDLVKEFCDAAFKDFAPPCKPAGNEPNRLVHSDGSLRGHEHEMDKETFGPDPFEPAGVGEIGGQ